MQTRPCLPVQFCLAFDPPPKHLDTPRQVILLRLEGRSIRAISRIIGCHRNTAKRYIDVAAQQLSVMQIQAEKKTDQVCTSP